MYRMYLDKNLIYQPCIEELTMTDIKYTLELNKAGELEFTIPPSHPYYDQISILKTYIDLYENDSLLGRFRIISIDEDFYKQRTVTCEGELSYLLDSIQRPYEFTGSISSFLQKILDVHNSQVEKEKQFEIGLCNVVDTNNYINRSNGNMSNTFSTINDKLIKTHGGYIRVRNESSHRYLDYISDYGNICSQVIRFGENLLDLSNYIKGENVRTAIIPLGAELKEEGINGVKKRIDITSVNEGKDYIYSEDAIKLFGWIWDTVEFKDVTLPVNLKKKAEAYLEECINLQVSLELTAVDLHDLNVDIEKIKLGDWIQVISEPHGLNKKFLVSKISYDIERPENNKVSLGTVLSTFTSETSKASTEISDRIELVASTTNQYVESAVDNATKLITGAMGGYMMIAQAEDGHPEGILIMDKPDKEQAQNVIQLNKNGLGFSTTGIKGPYRNAWTIDGHLVADFISSGVIQGIEIRGVRISGDTTINVGTDLYVGNNIYLGKEGDVAKSISFNEKSNIYLFRESIYFYTGEFLKQGGDVYAGNDNVGMSLYSNGKTIASLHMAKNDISLNGGYCSLESVFDIDIRSDHRLDLEATEGINCRGIFTIWDKFNAKDVSTFSDNVTVLGDLFVTGTKNRIVTTNFGDIKMNAVESADCRFTDEGQITLDEDGKATIFFDTVWLKTVNTELPYHIQLTPYCEVSPWIVKEYPDKCVVAGMPNTKVNWHVSAIQKGYENIRLEKFERGGI